MLFAAQNDDFVALASVFTLGLRPREPPDLFVPVTPRLRFVVRFVSGATSQHCCHAFGVWSRVYVELDTTWQTCRCLLLALQALLCISSGVNVAAVAGWNRLFNTLACGGVGLQC